MQSRGCAPISRPTGGLKRSSGSTGTNVLSVKSRLRVRVRPPHRMWTKAQCTYELGLDRQLGILLQQVCQIPGLSCCQVYIPKNQQDAEQRLIGSLFKLS